MYINIMVCAYLCFVVSNSLICVCVVCEASICGLYMSDHLYILAFVDVCCSVVLCTRTQLNRYSRTRCKGKCNTNDQGVQKHMV